MTINKEFLLANHAALVDELCADAAAAASAGAIKAERERIAAVLAEAAAGHERLLHAALADGLSAEQYLANVARAERDARAKAATDLVADAPKPVRGAAAPENEAAAEAALPLAERCKARWERDAELRAEFNDNLAAYQAFEKANAAGRARILQARR